MRSGLYSRNAEVKQCLRNFNNLTAAAGKNALCTCREKHLGWLSAPEQERGTGRAGELINAVSWALCWGYPMLTLNMDFPMSKPLVKEK